MISERQSLHTVPLARRVDGNCITSPICIRDPGISRAAEKGGNGVLHVRRTRPLPRR